MLNVKTAFLGFSVIILILTSASYVSASDVIINEFQIEPDNIQWVELYNKGEQTVDISGWVIDDSGGSQKYIIGNGINLSARKCISFQSGLFNFNTSSSDSAKLIVNNEIVDSYSYSKSPEDNVSFGRSVDGGDSWTTFSSPSRDRSNNTGEICMMPTFAPSPSSTPTLVPTKKLTNTPTPKLVNTNTPTSIKKSISTSIPLAVSNPTTKSSPSEAIIKQSVNSIIQDSDKNISSSTSEIEKEILGLTSSTEIQDGTPGLLLVILIVSGVGCIGGAVWLSYKKIKSSSAGIF